MKALTKWQVDKATTKTIRVGDARVIFKLCAWHNRQYPPQIVARRWSREIHLPSSTYDNAMWLSGWEPVKGAKISRVELEDLGGLSHMGSGVTEQERTDTIATAKRLLKEEERHKAWLAKGNLEAGIYGVVYGNRSKKFSIKPYQLQRRTFMADKVERIGDATETQDIGCDSKPLLITTKGYDAVLFGLGDD